MSIVWSTPPLRPADIIVFDCHECSQTHCITTDNEANPLQYVGSPNFNPCQEPPCPVCLGILAMDRHTILDVYARHRKREYRRMIECP